MFINILLVKKAPCKLNILEEINICLMRSSEWIANIKNKYEFNFFFVQFNYPVIISNKITMSKNQTLFFKVL